MQSAFVEIGLDSDAFLYVGDFLENLEDYDHVVAPAEGKVEKMEQQGGAVFAPPTAPELSPAQAPAPPEEEEPSPGNEALPAFTSPSSQGAPAGRPYRQQGPPSRPFQRQGQDRGPGGGGYGGGNDRGGRRRGGGGGGGGGRWGRGGRGNDRRPGRDLPPSKYASPRPFVPRPYTPPTDEPPVDYEPVILPGESLAKYKDRIPGAAPTSPANPPAESAGSSEAASSANVAAAPSLPASLYATPSEPLVADSPETLTEPFDVAEASAQIETPDARATAASETLAVPTPAHETPAHETIDAQQEHEEAPEALGTPDLTEDETSALAEQLAEARQEEASAEAEADSRVGMLDEERIPRTRERRRSR